MDFDLHFASFLDTTSIILEKLTQPDFELQLDFWTAKIVILPR